MVCAFPAPVILKWGGRPTSPSKRYCGRLRVIYTSALIDGLGVHPDGRYGFGAPPFLLRLGRQLAACGPHLDSDRVSGVIELRDAADFKMNLIMKDFEKQLLWHHSGLVHLEAGTTTSSGSSRRRLQSACQHFSFRQPCLPTSVPPVCPFWT